MPRTVWIGIVLVVAIGLGAVAGVLFLRDRAQVETTGWVRIEPASRAEVEQGSELALEPMRPATPALPIESRHQDAYTPPATPAPDRGPPVPGDPSVVHLAFTPKGKLATVLGDGTTWYRDLLSGASQEIGAKVTGISALALTPDGRGIVVVNSKGDLSFLDSATWLTNESFRTGYTGVNDVAFSPDGRSVALAGMGVIVWDIHDRQARRTLHPEQRCSSVSFSADGRQLLTASPAGVTFWETTFWQKEASLHGHDIVAVRFWTARGTFVTVLADGAIRIHDSASRRVQNTLGGGAGPMSDIALSPDGRTIAAIGRDGIHVWDSMTGTSRVLR